MCGFYTYVSIVFTCCERVIKDILLVKEQHKSEVKEYRAFIYFVLCQSIVFYKFFKRKRVARVFLW